jgi:hypothetical protein
MFTSSHPAGKSRQLYRDLKRDNALLHGIIESLQPLVSDRRITVNHWPEVKEKLGELRDQLAIHFSLEESDGYLNLRSGVKAEFICTVEYLRSQHVELFEEIRKIADAAYDTPVEQLPRVDAVIKRYQRFLTSLSLHEEAEWTLVQQLADDDLGVGD